MPLILQDNSLLRVPGGLAGSLSCCCDDPYAVCGSPAALRAINGFLDSEIAACGDPPELPDGWTVDFPGVSGCRSDDFFLYCPSPFIGAAARDQQTSPGPVEFLEPESPGDFQSPFIGDLRVAGQSVNSLGYFVLPPFGAHRDANWAGVTRVEQDEQGFYSERRSEYYSVWWDVGFWCEPQDAVECEVCGGGLAVRPGQWKMYAYIRWVSEFTDLDSGQNGYRAFRAWTFRDAVPFAVQSCQDVLDFTDDENLRCGVDAAGCSPRAAFFPDDTTIELSEDGVTIAGSTTPWSFSEYTDFGNTTPPTPSEITTATIEIYKAARACCCDGTYCEDENPLP